MNSQHTFHELNSEQRVKMQINLFADLFRMFVKFYLIPLCNYLALSALFPALSDAQVIAIMFITFYLFNVMVAHGQHGYMYMATSSKLHGNAK